MAEPTLLEAILKANAAQASGDASARAALPAGGMPFVISCMDPRLSGVLLPALGLEGLEAPQARFAGAVIRPGDVSGTRSVLAAAIFNAATEVLVVGHTDCRMGKMSSLDLRSGLARLGVRADAFDGQDPAAWLGVFSGEGQAVRSSVDVLRADPRIPPGMPVHGLLYNLHSRRAEVIVRGYEAARGSAAGAAMSSPGGMSPGPVDWASPPPAIFGTPGTASSSPRGPVGAGPSSTLGAGAWKPPSSAPPAPGPVAAGPSTSLGAGAWVPPVPGAPAAAPASSQFSSAGPTTSLRVGAAPPLPGAPAALGPPPPPIVPAGGSGPPASFPAPPAMAVPQQAAPAEIDLDTHAPPLPTEEPPSAPPPDRGRGQGRKGRPRGDSPFDRAQRTLERLRRDRDADK